MKTLKEYHELYLKCDVLLLVDVFEKSINNSLKNYELCPSHYLSTSALSWDEMLNMTKFVLELIPDTDMYIFFGKGTRVGTSENYWKIYDPKQELKQVKYLEANDEYTYAMHEFFITSGFKWIDRKEFDLNKYPDNILKGCTFHIDLEYPSELHKLHYDYCLTTDKIEIKRQISNYQLKIADFYNNLLDRSRRDICVL